MEDQWLCVSTTCGCGVKDSQVHGRYKTRMQPQRLSAGVLNHSSGHGKAKTPMENLCGVGCLRLFAGDYAAFFPKAFQVKAEVVSSQLEHTDGLSQLSGELALLYLCCKCTEVPRAGLLPDSHLTGQLSGLGVWPGQDRHTSDGVLSLSKFQVLVQKEGCSLHSDTQVHELTACYSSALDPWIAPVSWLVRTAEQRKTAALLTDTETNNSSSNSWRWEGPNTNGKPVAVSCWCCPQEGKREGQIPS